MAQAVTDAQPPLPQRAGFGRRVAAALIRRREASILVVLLGLVAYFSLRTDAFFGSDNAQLVAEYSAPIAIIAAGEVMLLICGEIDLSVGMVFAFSTWIFYFATTDWGLPIWLAVIVGLLSGALVGLVNGLITVMIGVPSFITTLGVAYALLGDRVLAEHAVEEALLTAWRAGAAGAAGSEATHRLMLGLVGYHAILLRRTMHERNGISNNS